jgi:hypothetical protein
VHSDHILSTASGQAGVSPVPASEPLDDVQAYLVGPRASQAGVDLATVVYTAIGTWPGTTRQISEAIASSAVAWCADQSRRDREGEP